MLRTSRKMEIHKFGRMGVMHFPKSTTDLKSDLCNNSARLVLTIEYFFLLI